MRILLTARAFERYWTEVLAVEPDAEAVLLDADGTFHLGDPLTAEVAWVTSDVYHDGSTRKFFGTAVHSPALRWFQSAAAGSDAPVFARLAARGVRITSAHVNAIPIAEYVVRAAIDHVHGAGRWREAAREARWESGPHREVHGTTWTVVGFGAIGREVASRAAAFGVTVRGVRRRARPEANVALMLTPDRLPAALEGADVVVLCTPLDASTVGMADDRFFSAMAPGSLFVNVGRGALVDEAALGRALDRGAPAAATLDVFAQEPLPPDHPFWGHGRVTVTPHVAGSGSGNDDRLAGLFCANLAAFRRGDPLAHEVDPATLS